MQHSSLRALGLQLALAATALAAFPLSATAAPLSGEAYHRADAAYAAYAHRDYDKAVLDARRAVKLRPDVPRLRLLLVRSLVAAKRPRAALAAGRRAEHDGQSSAELRTELSQLRLAAVQPTPTAAPPPPSSPPGYEAAQRAYADLADGQYPAGVQDAKIAVNAAPTSVAYRALLVDLLDHAGDTAEAETAASDAIGQTGPDAGLLSRQAYLLIRLGRPAEAADAFRKALAISPAEDRMRLSLGLADAEQAAGRPSEALAALQPYADDPGYEVTARRASALSRLGRREEALAATRAALAAAPDQAARSAQTYDELTLLVALRHDAEARAVLHRAVSEPTFGAGMEADLAELALQIKDDADAEIYFERARAAGKLSGKVMLDAAYVAKRTGHNRTAVELFDKALVADDANHEFTPGYRFRLGREATDIDRTWGANASLLSGAVNFAGAGNGLPTADNSRVTQLGGEIYYRPPVIGYNDGRTVEVFARIFSTVQDDTGGATGEDSVQGYLGARWKPFGGQNLVLEASRLIKLGSASRNDWLLRAAYSQDHGLDLVADTSSTIAWQVYGEIDRLTDSAQTLGLADARLGEAFRPRFISRNLVVTPLVDLSYSYDQLAGRKSALGIGPGISFRYWFRDVKDRGPASYVDFNVGRRFKISGDDRADGFFATLSVAY